MKPDPCIPMTDTSKQQRLTALERHIARLSRRLTLLEARSGRLSTARLLIVLAGLPLLLAGLFSTEPLLFWLPLLLTGLSFGAAVALHRRVERAAARMRLWRELKQQQYARATLDWQRLRPPLRPEKLHPLEIDLDLMVLHRLLDSSTTAGGRAHLREWLLPLDPDAAQIAARQQAVRELATRPAFGDKLALHARLAAREGRPTVDFHALADWLARPAPSAGRALPLLGALALLNAGLLALNAAALLPPLWVGGLFVYALLYYRQRAVIGPLFDQAAALADALRRLGAVTDYLERRGYAGMPQVELVCGPVLRDRPTGSLRRVTRVLAAASLRYNPVLWPLVNMLLPWDLYFAERLRVQRQALAAHLPAWLDVWYDLEALVSLAGLAYLNPACSFPQLVDGDGPLFAAEHIGHPLLPDVVRVHNDFAFSECGQVALITGSNMAGKSSFLRTLGVNLCLAYAGGPVFAARLSLRVMRLFSSMRLTDSLDDGISYFYAEVQRLRALLDALEADDPRPLFFLIDEIFRGTNNRERLAGSRAYVQALVGRHGAGLIATHDLELVRLAEGRPQVRNFHFRERVEGGRMVFDYALQAGPCPTTNALRIMALAGLPVEAEAE